MRQAFLLLIIIFASVTVNAQQTTFTPICSGSAAADTAKFAAIITATSPNDITIRIPYKRNTAERCAITGTINWPSRVTLDNTDGSGINVVAGTLTVEGARINPPGKTMFFGGGTTVLNGPTFVSSDDPRLDVDLSTITGVLAKSKGGTGITTSGAQNEFLQVTDGSGTLGYSNTLTNPVSKSTLGVFARAEDSGTAQQIALSLPASAFTSYKIALPPNTGTTGFSLVSIGSTSDTLQLGLAQLGPTSLGSSFSTDPTLAPNSDNVISSQKALKTYIDNVAAGQQFKDPVRVATVANGTLATAYENSDTVDGIVLATTNRILIKNQTTQTENGIYTVEASGAPTRSTDADADAELLHAAALVLEGTVNANTTWVNNNTSMTIGVTNVTFAQTAAQNVYTDGAGLDLAGNQFSVAAGGVTNTMLAGSIAASKLVGTDIATVGTITAGAWNVTGGAVTAGTSAFTTSTTSPLMLGGTAANDDITIKGTTSATKTTSFVLAQPDGGKVGIGTTGPNATLTVIGGSNPSSLPATNAMAYFSSTEAGADTEIAIDSYGAAAGTPAKSTLMFRAARGSVTTPTATQANDVLGLLDARGYGTTAFATTPKASMRMVAEETWTDAAQGTFLSFFTTTPTTTTTAERMRINGSGNVGIGTTTPIHPLDISGSEATDFILRLNNTQASPTTNDGARIQLSVNGVSTGQIMGNREDASGTASALVFSTRASSTTLEKVRITSVGNVGIGTSTPAQKLSVVGTVESTSGGFKFPDGTTQVTASAGASSTVQVVNCKTAHGAVGDDATDNTTALNACLTAGAGGVVYIPEGIYRTDPLNAPAANTTIMGDGKGISILKRKLNANTSALLTFTNAKAILESITIDGNCGTPTLPADVVTCSNQSSISYDELRVRAADVTLRDVEVKNTALVSITVMAARARILNPTLTGFGSTTVGPRFGVQAGQASGFSTTSDSDMVDLVVDGGVISDYLWNGVITKGITGGTTLTNTSYYRNHLRSSGTGGHVALGCDSPLDGNCYHRVIGNRFVGSTSPSSTNASAIEINGSGIIADNYGDGAGVEDFGIGIQGGTNYTVTGNLFKNYGEGLHVDEDVSATDYIVARTNNFRENTVPINVTSTGTHNAINSFISEIAKGPDVASASSITPSGTTFTLTGTTTVNTISTTGITTGTAINIVTTSAVPFTEAGNIDITGSTSLTTLAGSLVQAVWDGTKWRMASVTVGGGGSGDMLRANNLSDVTSASTSFTNIKQAATTGVTGVVQVSVAPAGSPIAVETGDPRVSVATGARIVYARQFPGATLGAQIAAAETALGASPGEIIVEVNGNQAINQQITFAEGRVVRFTGSGTITSTNSGAGNPYLVMRNNSTLECASDAVILQVPSGASNFEIFRTFSANTDNDDRTTGIRIRGCRFQGLLRVGDGAQSLVDLGNCVDCNITDNHFENADTIGLQVGGSSNGMTAKTISIVASVPADSSASLITTSTAHGFAAGDRVRISGVTTPRQLNSVQSLTDVVTNSTTTITSATANFTDATHKGQRIQLFKASPSVNIMTVIVSVTNTTTVVVADNPGVTTTGVAGDVVFANGGTWVVHTIPSTTTFTVEYAPTSTGTCSGTCTGTATLLNEARDVVVTNNSFTGGSLVDVAPVNAKRILINNNLFGSRGQCTSGAAVDVEPNVYADASGQITISNNNFDLRGGACEDPTAYSAIVLGGGFGLPEQIVINGNIIRGTTIAPGDYGASPSGGAQSTAWQLQSGILIWQARDVLITNNSIQGYYNTGISSAGQSQSERWKISNNHFVAAQGAVVTLANVRRSEVTDNTYEWRNWLGDSSFNVGAPVGTMAESLNSGSNLYRNNTGITTYTLDASSFLQNGAKGADVASAGSITPSGSAFTITGTTTINTIVATGVGITTGSVLQMVTSGVVTFSNAGNMTFNAAAASLTTAANDIVSCVWDSPKWRCR